MRKRQYMNFGSASEIHRVKPYIERFWASGRIVGHSEVIVVVI